MTPDKPMTSDELKPCPFCNGKAAIFERYRGLWNVHCLNIECGATIDPTQRSREACVEAWNHRMLVERHLMQADAEAKRAARRTKKDEAA